MCLVLCFVVCFWFDFFFLNRDPASSAVIPGKVETAGQETYTTDYFLQ